MRQYLAKNRIRTNLFLASLLSTIGAGNYCETLLQRQWTGRVRGYKTGRQQQQQHITQMISTKNGISRFFTLNF